MTTGRINQVHASPPGYSTLVNTYMFASVLKTSRHFTRNSTQYSATRRCAHRCLPSRLTQLTPELKKPKHTKDALEIHSRHGSYMLCMLFFTIHTFLRTAHYSAFEVTVSDTAAVEPRTCAHFVVVTCRASALQRQTDTHTSLTATLLLPQPTKARDSLRRAGRRGL